MANLNALANRLPGSRVPAVQGSAVSAGTLSRPGNIRQTVAGRQLEVIDAKWTPVVEKNGLKGLLAFAKSNPTKTTAAIVGMALAGDWAYNELMDLVASAPDDPVVQAAWEQVHTLRRDNGMFGPVAGQDDLIGGKPEAEALNQGALALESLEICQNAVAAVRGLPQLLALMEWLNLDPDRQEWCLSVIDSDVARNALRTTGRM